jgi:hypothetical protein
MRGGGKHKCTVVKLNMSTLELVEGVGCPVLSEKKVAQLQSGRELF